MEKNNCLFCKIINKTIPSFIIYEDEKTLAFLDIMPVTKGHILIIPKIHSDNFLESNETDTLAVIKTAKVITSKLNELLNTNNFNLLINNGVNAGQTIYHFHCHIIPRYNDFNNLLIWKTLDVTKETLEKLQTQLKIK